MEKWERGNIVRSQGHRNGEILQNCPVCGWGGEQSKVEVWRFETVEKIEETPARLTFEHWVLVDCWGGPIHVAECTRQDRQSFLIPSYKEIVSWLKARWYKPGEVKEFHDRGYWK